VIVVKFKYICLGEYDLIIIHVSAGLEGCVVYAS